jgi:hypothetical protein
MQNSALGEIFIFSCQATVFLSCRGLIERMNEEGEKREVPKINSSIKIL